MAVASSAGLVRSPRDRKREQGSRIEGAVRAGGNCTTLDIPKTQLPSHTGAGQQFYTFNVKLEDAPKGGERLKPPTV